MHDSVLKPDGLVSLSPPLSRAAILEQLADLACEKHALGRELARCQDQLSLVFEITGHVTSLDDGDAIEAALLRRYQALLQAQGVYLDRGGCCRRVATDPRACAACLPGADQLRMVLAGHVELVRRTRRACVPPLSADQVMAMRGVQVLLSAIYRGDVDVGVVIALRAPDQPPFDGGDLLAAEAVLAYGTQVLGSVMTIQHLQRTALQTVCTLVNAIDAKDNYTSAHSQRVGSLARMTGESLGLDREQLQNLEWAGLLHDVGKIGIPEQILNKPGVLTASEFELMKRHSEVGFEVLKPVTQFEPVLDTVLHHHENHDGSGYPQGLYGDRIPLHARIVHVVDIFDALTSHRPYRQGYGLERAFDLLRNGAGRTTDPQVTEVFIETLLRYREKEPAAFRLRFDHLSSSSVPLVIPRG